MCKLCGFSSRYRIAEWISEASRGASHRCHGLLTQTRPFLPSHITPQVLRMLCSVQVLLAGGHVVYEPKINNHSRVLP